jgi:hypothetical protein
VMSGTRGAGTTKIIGIRPAGLEEAERAEGIGATTEIFETSG